jgi:hypothetical protein
MAVLMVKRTPWTPAELTEIAARAASLDFDILLRPGRIGETEFIELANGSGRELLEARLGLDLSAPTDDRPFFFNMLRLKDAVLHKVTSDNPNLRAVSVLGNLLMIVTFGVIICIALPLVVSADRGVVRSSLSVIGFFGFIGLGFMLVEISLMQRLIVFLGHPTYALSVILFVLLLAGGVGSALTSWVGGRVLVRTTTVVLLALIGLLIVCAMLSGRLVMWFGGATTPVRIAIATAILAPLGVLMGMPFPLGMRLANTSAKSLTPLLWGVNGALSIYASVLAIALALEAGIGVTMLAGAVAYASGAVAFVRAGRRGGTVSPRAAINTD